MKIKLRFCQKCKRKTIDLSKLYKPHPILLTKDRIGGYN